MLVGLQAGVILPARSQSLPQTLAVCTHIALDSDRLACFDREVGALSRGASAKAPAAGISQAPPAQSTAAVGGGPATRPVATPPSSLPPAPPSLTPEQRLGLSPEGVRKLEAKQGLKVTPEVKNLTAHIASVSHSASGRMVITLDNGQVWRQSESRSTFEAQPGDVATISPGALGSFWLATGKHSWTRVERIP